MLKTHYISAEVKTAKDDEDSGVFEVIASSGKVDRLGDTISPDGWYLNNYKKNPIMLWSHDRSNPPIAKATKTWVEDKKLKLKGVFAKTPFAQELKQLVQDSFLNAVSVGFMPLKEDAKKGKIKIEGKMWRRWTEKEMKKGLYDSDYGVKFTKQELLEVSWVSVPALPSALVTARKMNLALLTKALEETKKEVKDKPKTKKKNKSVVTIRLSSALKKRFEDLEKTLKNINKKLEQTISNESADKKSLKPTTPVWSAKTQKSKEERLLILADKAIEIVRRRLKETTKQ